MKKAIGNATMNINIPTNLGAISLMQCINVIFRTFASTEDLISATGFSEHLEFPTIVTNFENPSQIFSAKPNFYLIQEKDPKKLENLTKILTNVVNPSFNPRGKFIFISNNFSADFRAYIASFYIVNAIFLRADTEEIFTYFPYAENNLNVVETNLELLGRCEDVPNLDLFPLKVPKTWKNTTVQITFRYYDAYAMCDACDERGIDIDMMNIILEHSNVKASYEKMKNENEDSLYTSFEIFLGNYGPSVGRKPYGEFSMSYTEDAVVWIIPAPHQIPRWKYFLEIYDLKVWIAFVSSVCIISITWGFARSIIYGMSFSEFLTVPITTFIIFLGQAFRFHSVLMSHQVLAVLIIFLSVMMNFFFATRLTYLLNGNNLEGDIKSLSDAMDNKLKIGCVQALAPLFNNSKKYYDHLKSHFLQCDQTPKCLMRAAIEKDIAVCRTIRRARFLKSLVDEKTGKWMVKELYPPIFVKQVAAFFRKGLPLFSLFNGYIYSLVESGILNFIIKKYEKTSAVDDLSTPTRKLQFEYIVAPLFIWFFGLLLAGFAFWVERLQYKYVPSSPFEMKENNGIRN